MKLIGNHIQLSADEKPRVTPQNLTAAVYGQQLLDKVAPLLFEYLLIKYHCKKNQGSHPQSELDQLMQQAKEQLQTLTERMISANLHASKFNMTGRDTSAKIAERISNHLLRNFIFKENPLSLRTEDFFSVHVSILMFRYYCAEPFAHFRYHNPIDDLLRILQENKLGVPTLANHFNFSSLPNLLKHLIGSIRTNRALFDYYSAEIPLLKWNKKYLHLPQEIVCNVNLACDMGLYFLFRLMFAGMFLVFMMAENMFFLRDNAFSLFCLTAYMKYGPMPRFHQIPGRSGRAITLPSPLINIPSIIAHSIGRLISGLCLWLISSMLQYPSTFSRLGLAIMLGFYLFERCSDTFIYPNKTSWLTTQTHSDTLSVLRAYITQDLDDIITYCESNRPEKMDLPIQTVSKEPLHSSLRVATPTQAQHRRETQISQRSRKTKEQSHSAGPEKENAYATSVPQPLVFLYLVLALNGKRYHLPDYSDTTVMIDDMLLTCLSSMTEQTASKTDTRRYVLITDQERLKEHCPSDATLHEKEIISSSCWARTSEGKKGFKYDKDSNHIFFKQPRRDLRIRYIPDDTARVIDADNNTNEHVVTYKMEDTQTHNQRNRL